MNIGVVMTRGLSLEAWDAQGLIERELLLFRKLLDAGLISGLNIFSYGHQATERQVVDRFMPGYSVAVAGWPLWFSRVDGRGWIRAFLIFLWSWRQASRSDVFVSNQLDGAWVAFGLAVCLRKPFIFRMGYRQLSLEREMKRLNFFLLTAMRLIEGLLLKRASVVIVTSDFIKSELYADYGPELSKRIHVVPSVFDFKLFQAGKKNWAPELVFGGRISPEKNIKLIGEACGLAGWDLKIFTNSSDASCDRLLSSLSISSRERVVIKKGRSNRQIAEELGRASFLVLLSSSEGLPKILVEGMASGCVCIVSDIPAHSHIISDGLNGFISDIGAQELANKLVKIGRLEHGILESMSNKAVVTVNEKFDIAKSIKALSIAYKAACSG